MSILGTSLQRHTANSSPPYILVNHYLQIKMPVITSLKYRYEKQAQISSTTFLDYKKKIKKFKDPNHITIKILFHVEKWERQKFNHGESQSPSSTHVQ